MSRGAVQPYDSAGESELVLATRKAALKGWESESPSCGDHWTDQVNSAIDYYSALFRVEQWRRAAELIQRMNSHPQARSEALVGRYGFFMGQGDHLRQVALKSGLKHALDQLLSCAVLTVASYGPEGQTALALRQKAEFLFRMDAEKSPLAVTMAQAAAADEEIADSLSDYRWVQNLAEKELARYYFTQALAAREKDMWPEVGQYAHRLVHLVYDMKDSHDNVIFEQRDCAHILAAWHTINNRPKQAHRCVEVAIKLVLEMLSDNDPDNDVTAWLYLQDAILVLGNVDRAVTATNAYRRGIALSVCGNDDDEPTNHGAVDSISTADAIGGAEDEDGTQVADVRGKQESNKTEPSLADASSMTPASDSREMTTRSRPVPGFVSFSCDGPCFDAIPNGDAFYRCRFCVADFCEDCHKLIKGNEMTKLFICGASHDHVDRGSRVVCPAWHGSIERQRGAIGNVGGRVEERAGLRS